MKISIYMEAIHEPERIFPVTDIDTTDCHSFLVAPYSDPDLPYVRVPEGYSIVGFRFFSNENSLTVYLGKGKLYVD